VKALSLAIPAGNVEKARLGMHHREEIDAAKRFDNDDNYRLE
jgi:hypothetical protein